MAMQDKVQRVLALVELEKRGALPADLQPVLQELRARGIAPEPETAPTASLLGSQRLGQALPGVTAAMVAAGQSAESLGLGAGDLAARITGDEDARRALKSRFEESQRLMAPLEQERPVSTFAGSLLPYMTVPIGMAGGAAGRAISAIPRAQRAGQDGFKCFCNLRSFCT